MGTEWIIVRVRMARKNHIRDSKRAAVVRRPCGTDWLPAQVKYDEGDLSNLFSHLTNSSINKCCRTSAQLAAAPTPAPAPLLARRKLLKPFWHCKQNESSRGQRGARASVCSVHSACAREPSRAVPCGRYSPHYATTKETIGAGCKWSLQRLQEYSRPLRGGWG